MSLFTKIRLKWSDRVPSAVTHTKIWNEKNEFAPNGRAKEVFEIKQLYYFFSSLPYLIGTTEVAYQENEERGKEDEFS